MTAVLPAGRPSFAIATATICANVAATRPMAKKPTPRPLSLVSSSSRPPASTEWVGGIRDMPDVPALGGRISVVIWVTDGRILVGEPAPRASAKQVLAMRVKAAAATEGRPSTVRVATQDEASRVRAVLGRDVTVRVGPTPEVDTAFDTIMGQLAQIAELADHDEDDDPRAPRCRTRSRS